MGCSCKGSPAPVVVDAGASAMGQATFNKDAALQQRSLNMVDQYTPQGSLTYEKTGTEEGGIPGMKQTTTYSPEQQKLYDTSIGLQQKYGDIGATQLGAVQSKLESPFSLDSLGAAPTINEATRTATRDAMLARLQPQMDKDRAALETQLANQGFVSGTQGYNTAMDERNRAVNDLYLGADVSAGSEMANMYGLQSSQRDKAINEILMQRNQPLSELASFMSGSQPTNPSFVGTPQGSVAAPDFQSAQLYNANAQNTANQNSYNNNMQGLYGIAGAAAGNTGYTKAGGWTWG